MYEFFAVERDGLYLAEDDSFVPLGKGVAEFDTEASAAADAAEHGATVRKVRRDPYAGTWQAD